MGVWGACARGGGGSVPGDVVAAHGHGRRGGDRRGLTWGSAPGGTVAHGNAAGGRPVGGCVWRACAGKRRRERRRSRGALGIGRRAGSIYRRPSRGMSRCAGPVGSGPARRRTISWRIGAIGRGFGLGQISNDCAARAIRGKHGGASKTRGVPWGSQIRCPSGSSASGDAGGSADAVKAPRERLEAVEHRTA